MFLSFHMDFFYIDDIIYTIIMFYVHSSHPLSLPFLTTTVVRLLSLLHFSPESSTPSSGDEREIGVIFFYFYKLYYVTFYVYEYNFEKNRVLLFFRGTSCTYVIFYIIISLSPSFGTIT